MDDIDDIRPFAWFVDCSSPFEIVQVKRHWVVFCERSDLFWARRRPECEAWVCKIEGARIDHQAQLAREAKAVAAAKAARAARRVAIQADAARQLCLF